MCERRAWQQTCMPIERKCLARSKPASNSASAGIIFKTSTEATTIQVVSPGVKLHAVDMKEYQ